MRCQRDEHEVYLSVSSELEDSDNDGARGASTLPTTGKTNSARWRGTATARRRPRRGEQTRGSARASRARGVARLHGGEASPGSRGCRTETRRWERYNTSRIRGGDGAGVGLALSLKGLSSCRARRGARAALATGEARLRDGEMTRELSSRRGGGRATRLGGGGARRRRRRARGAAVRFRTELGEGRRGSNAGAEAGLGRRAHLWKAAGRS